MGPSYLLSIFLENSLYEISLISITEQVDEKRSTLGTNRNTDCLLKNTFTKQQICCQELHHFDADISFRNVLLELECVCREANDIHCSSNVFYIEFHTT